MSKQGSNKPTEDDGWTNKRPSKKKKKLLRLEYRMRPREGRSAWTKRWEEWRTFHKKYRTEEQRTMAMVTMNHNDSCFEYRLPKKERKENDPT